MKIQIYYTYVDLEPGRCFVMLINVIMNCSAFIQFCLAPVNQNTFQVHFFCHIIL